MKVLTKKAVAMLTALLMVFVMMPQFGLGQAFAEESYEEAPGGIVWSDGLNASAAFAEHVDVSHYNGNTSINLNSNILLGSPIVIKQRNAGDNLTIYLNGHTLTGAPGTCAETVADAKGKDAIQIIPGEFNVGIDGYGSVVGGKGGVYQRDDRYRTGQDGGNAISFVAPENGSYWYPEANDGKLNYGLSIGDMTNIVGGAGGDVTEEDWINNISCSADHTLLGDGPHFILKAGNGGAGIGQADTGKQNGATTLAYAHIFIYMLYKF